MSIKPEYALLEFYVSLVTYTVMHMIFVISSDFVEAFNIPPLNIGIYVDKLAAIRALLMVIADILEWLITQEYLHDPGAYTKLSDKSARRIGSVLSFIIMWFCRCHYIWLVYFSNNKSLVAFINLSIEGFWFGVFQMSFFAIGPEYNAFTSLAIHTMGNFIFFFQLILNKLSKSRPYINCLYRVRAHAWICLVITTISLGPWVWFCDQYIKGDTTQYNALVGQLQATTVTSDSASQIANDLAQKMRTGSGSGQEVKALVREEFGYEVHSVDGATSEVQVKIRDTASTERGKARVTVTRVEPAGGDTPGTITIKVLEDNGTVSKAVGRRIARRLAKTLTKVDSVTKTGPPPETIKITVSIDQKINQIHVWSPFMLFIVGAFAEDFAVPGILPFAFLDPEKANLVNYFTPSFFFTGAFIILLLNDVFSGEQSVLMDVTDKGIKGLDSQFKEWSEGEADGWHGLWALNVPKYLSFFLAMWSIHGTFDSLRCIVQCRWRVMLLTMFVVIPRATLEVAGYVGVANFAIAQGETMDFYGFKFIAWHDMLAMFCRFVYGKFAVGYNSTSI